MSRVVQHLNVGNVLKGVLAVAVLAASIVIGAASEADERPRRPSRVPPRAA